MTWPLGQPWLMGQVPSLQVWLGFWSRAEPASSGVAFPRSLGLTPLGPPAVAPTSRPRRTARCSRACCGPTSDPLQPRDPPPGKWPEQPSSTLLGPGPAGAEHQGALAVPRPSPRGGPARGLLPGPRLSLGCPESGSTGRVLAACRLPAKPWEPGEQADPWDREPAAFPAPPTHSPVPALPAGLWGRQPAQPCPQASSLG